MLHDSPTSASRDSSRVIPGTFTITGGTDQFAGAGGGGAMQVLVPPQGGTFRFRPDGAILTAA
jgi:hypothetical protein